MPHPVTSDSGRPTALALAQAVTAGVATRAEVVASCLARIAAGNASLNAVRELRAAARDEATAFDRRPPGGALDGVPILVKDSICTTDGTATTFGVKAFESLRTPFEAAIIARLRAAGAIILGKCSCTDFGDYVSSTMPAEHSTTGGVVANPCGPRYGRGGGSSTGVAAAVGAGFAPVAIGSEAQNSIQAPAANTGLVGLKPTVGLLAGGGDVPLVYSHTTAGVIATTVADCARVLECMTAAGPGSGLLAACGADGLRGARIGVARTGFFGRPGREQYDAAAELALGVLMASGAVVVDPAEVDTAEEVLQLGSSVFKSEFKIGLNRFLERLGGAAPVASLAALIAFNERAGDAAIPYGQDLLLAAEATSGDPTDPGYRADRERDLALTRTHGFDSTFDRHQLDALVVPMDWAAKLTGKAGYPVVTVPCGRTAVGYPVALSFIGRAHSEPRLIAIASAFEQAFAGTPGSARPEA